MPTVGQIICLWIDVPTECEGRPVLFEAVSNFFGLWHEHRRGNHNGLHEFYFAKNYVMLFNVYSQNSGKTYRHLMPSGTRLFHHNEFDKNKLSSSLQLHPTKADRAGMSCVEVRTLVSPTILPSTSVPLSLLFITIV